MIDVLKKTELFSDFNEKQLKAIAKLGKRILIEKENNLFSKGVKSDGVYVILGGKFIASYNDVEKEYTRGDILSEIGLIKEVNHKIDLKAVQKSQVFLLPRDKFKKLKESSPKFALTFQDALFKILLRKTENLENIFLK